VPAHAYADEGIFSVKVTLTDDLPGTASLTQTGALTVAEADTLVAGPLIIAFPTANTPVSFVTHFGDAHTSNVAGDFTATIDWGDGTISAGTVSARHDLLPISVPAHAYADEGIYSVNMAVVDDAPGTASHTFSTMLTVSDADTLVASPSQ